jgi:F0F1-type ATP synthase membrane subunit b/b'
MQLNPLAQINPLVIVTVGVIFVATYFVLRKVFFSPVIDVMERRFEHVQEAKTMRERAAEVGRTSEHDAEDALAAAGAKVEAILDRSREEAGRARQARLGAVREETDRLLEAGRSDIMEAREAELAKLREETTVCVTIACDKLLHGADPHVVSSVVDRLVAKRVH